MELTIPIMGMVVILIAALNGIWFWYLKKKYFHVISDLNHQITQYQVRTQKIFKSRNQWIKYEKELMRSSKVLLHSHSYENPIEEVFTNILNASGATRAFLYMWPEITQTRTELKPQHIVTTSKPLPVDAKENVLILEKTLLENLGNHLPKGRPLYLSQYELGDYAWTSFKDQHIQTLCFLPVFVKEQLYAIIRMDGHLPKTYWSMEDEYMLPLAAQIIGRYLEQKMAEKVLKDKAELFEELCENTIELIQNVSLSGHILYANSVWLNTLGYNKSELGHMKITDVIHPEEQKACFETIKKVLSIGTTRYLRTTFVNKCGQKVYVEGNIYCVRNHSGVIEGTRGFFLNTTKKMKLSSELEKLATFPEQFRDPIIEADMDGTPIYLNPAAKDHFPSLTALGNSHPVMQELMDIVSKSETNGKTVQDYELEYEQHSYLVQIAPLSLHKQYRFFFLETTSREEAKKKRNEFVDIIAHEIRNPLTVMLHSINLISQEKIGALTNEQKKVISITERNMARMNKVVHGLLDFSRLESGQAKIQRKTLPIETAIEEVIQNAKISNPTKNITMHTNIPPTTPPIYADEDMVGQVLTNLLSNALRFAKTEITIGAQTSEGGVQIMVSDDGEGIAKEDLPLLFDKFIQLKRKKEKGYKGTGLGLAICKEIMKLHHGRIWASSTPNHGATFYTEWPAFSKEKADNVQPQEPIRNRA